MIDVLSFFGSKLRGKCLGVLKFSCVSPLGQLFRAFDLRTLEKAFGVLHRCSPQKIIQDAELPEDFIQAFRKTPDAGCAFKLLALFHG